MSFSGIRKIGAALAGAVVALALTPHAGASPASSEPAASLAQLHIAKAQLDAAAPSAAVTSWYVDPAAHTLVIEALPDADAAVAEFIAAGDVAAQWVQIVPVASAPELYQPYPLREGDSYFTNGSRCTVGFLIRVPAGTNGFITAGHCGGVGTPTRGFNQQPQGTFRTSVFPGSDWAIVLVSSDWIPMPRATGSQEAPIGSTVCKIGSTTGTTCGMIQARNVSVNYPQGVVTGLIRTSLCAQPGDSGGPVFAGTQGQGIVSGGSGNCTVGGVTFVQPLNPILNAAGVTLLTA